MKTRMIIIAVDFVLISTSFFLSSWWFNLSENGLWIFYALFLAVKITLFLYFGLYRAILRFAGFPLAISIIEATALSSIALLLISKIPIFGAVPISFFVMDFFMTTFLVGFSRFLPRYLSEYRMHMGRKRTLIYGAGALGEEVARKLIKSNGDYRLIGFIDDKSSKIGNRIHNRPVLGPITDLKEILAHNKVDELIIAIRGISGGDMRRITRECNRVEVCCRIVPDFTDVLNKEIDIKDVDITDLLKREPRDLDKRQIERFLKEKVILITGAAGSIGSELVRQCLSFQPKRLLMLDNSEYGLFQLEEELGNENGSSFSLPRDSLEFILMDLTEKGDILSLVERKRPDIIFHAAAYKHVPMLEANPFAAVHNNVRGTLNVAQAAHEFKVDKFVLISTDKAVRPTSIMGATKRVCELYIQNQSLRSKTEFLSVRFGNVLGSSGSVIPKFIDQINRGGPVTVTHPHVKRYFMLTQEAVLLVMQAASLGNGGEIFILNMGDSINIAEMAEDLIYLSGKRPHEDIKVVFIGLRPGEKLYEELLIDEMEKKTQYEDITIGKTTVLDWDRLNESIDQLLMYSRLHDRNSVISTIRSLVPGFSQTASDDTATSQPNLIPFPAVK